MEVGEEPERVQRYDGKRRQGKGDQRSGAARAANDNRDQAQGYPHPGPRKPARELIEAKRKLHVPRAAREAGEESIALAEDLAEPNTISGVIELEVPLSR